MQKNSITYMKKILLTFLGFLVLNTSLTAQSTVFKGASLFNGSDNTSYFVMSSIDDKELSKYAEKWLDSYGKVTKLEKYNYKLDKIKGNKWSDELGSIQVQVKSMKRAQKVIFFFLNKNGAVLNQTDMRDQDAFEFIESYNQFCLRNEEVKLVASNFENANDELSNANKTFNKLQKSLEKNLKEQENLGKKLDSSPEAMSKALSEKEEIVGQIVGDNIDTKTVEDLNKASTSKEKEIQKIKKEKEKAESKLSKKEAEFDVLRNELMQAKRNIKSYEAIVKDSEAIKRKAEKLLDAL
jgi:predicted  nucleic acid-binding Zn-ribbon protein